MWDVFRTVLCNVLSALKTQRDLALENLALRHQLAVYERQKRKPRLEDRDRLVWIGLRRLWPSWQTQDPIGARQARHYRERLHRPKVQAAPFEAAIADLEDVPRERTSPWRTTVRSREPSSLLKWAR